MLDLLFILAISLVVWWTFWSGFSDASNAITTVVATRVLRPWQAVLLSAAGNFIGLFLGTAVAETIGKGVLEPGVASTTLIIAAILGGTVWEFITYKKGIPISETQVMIGALVGAAIAAKGFAVVKFSNILLKILLPMALAPILAFLAVILLAAILLRLTRRFPVNWLNHCFRNLQLLSSLFFSISHGANDGQKSLGLLLALFTFHGLQSGPETIPFWLKLLIFASLSAGTLFGGWRIVQTMGFRLAKLRPWQGFAAETSAAVLITCASAAGFPLSTSQTVAGSIMGASAARGKHAINLSVVREVLIGWLLTLPVSILLGYAAYAVIGLLG